MASSLVPAPNDNLVIVVVYADSLCRTNYSGIDRFLNELKTKPDFLLAQNVKGALSDDPRNSFLTALGGEGIYSTTEAMQNEVKIRGGTKTYYNLIMAKSEHEGEQIPSELQCYCAGKFTFNDKSILMISYNGVDIRDPFDLEKDLKMFLKLKKENKCKHLIIGGTFGFKMEQLKSNMKGGMFDK